MRPTISFLAVALLAACGSGAGTMTAKEHRREAAEHEAQAEAAAGVPQELVDAGFGQQVHHISWGGGARAAAHRSHALEHLRAAQELEKAEAQACGQLSEEQRSTCPLEAHGADALSYGERGIAIRLTQDAEDPRAVEADLRCHLAYTAAEGATDEDRGICPLLVKPIDVQVIRVGDETWVLLQSEVPAERMELERRAKALWGTR